VVVAKNKQAAAKAKALAKSPCRPSCSASW